MIKQTTCYSCDKPIEPEWLPEGEFIVCDECSSTTDKLSVEKLQSDNETLKKALTEIASTRQWRGGTSVGFEATEDAQIAINALAAIGNEGSGGE